MSNFEQMMEELKKEYVESLPSKIAEIQKQVEANNIQDVREYFHKLKGTGKTYGLPEITELGEVMEKLCIQNPGEARQYVPSALILLRKIHSERSLARAVNLSLEQSFSQLKALV